MKLWLIIELPLLIWALHRLIKEPRNATVTLSWAYFIIFIPIAGPLIYILFGDRNVRHSAFKNNDLVDAESPIARTPMSSYHSYKLICDSGDARREIFKLISEAKHTIYIEYYIIQNDKLGDALLDLLSEMAKKGVQVYLLYDWYGSILISRKKIKKLKACGAHVACFTPLKNITHVVNPNLRNHRKLIVIDQQFAVTGSANVGRKYLENGFKGKNQDYILVLEGEVVQQLSSVFRMDWQFSSEIQLQEPPTISKGNDIPVQLIESGPHRKFENLHYTVLDLITRAKTKISIVTPYIIPSEPVLCALILARLRGVDVEIVVPKKADRWLVQHANLSFCKELASYGISVHLYTKTFLHSKILLVDEVTTMLGTANLDCRSFRLNFELALIFNEENVAQDTRAIIDFYTQDASLLHFKGPQDYKFVENFARVWTPQL